MKKLTNQVSQPKVTNAEPIGPFRSSFGYTVQCYQFIAPAVIGLFLSRSPSAILQRVWTVIVDSFQCVFRGRTLSHIGQKVFKACPSFTNINSSTTVIFKRRIAGISTPLTHVFPHAPLGSFTLSVSRSGSEPLQTTTTLRAPASQICSSSNNYCSTFTTTNPTNSAVSPESLSANPKRRKFPKLSIGQILKTVMIYPRSTRIIFIHALILILVILNSNTHAADLGYLSSIDCGTLSPVEDSTICLQTTTTGGRTEGKLYSYTGSAWVEVTSSSSGGHVIKDEGTSRPQRTNLNFVGGGISCIDDPGNDETECTVSTSAAPGFDTIATGSNTTATMTVGTGASIAISGSGTVAATSLTASSATLATGITDETGTGVLVFNNTPTLTTPTIASFTNATHNHTNAAGGGQITDAALSTQVGIAKGGTNATTEAGARTNLAVPGLATTNVLTAQNTFEHDIQFDAATPAQIAANTDDYAGCADKVICRVSTDASRNLTGLAAASADYRIKLIVNVGTQNLVFKHDTTSTAANRFYTEAAGDLTLGSSRMALVFYDTVVSRWRVSLVTQGTITEVDTLDTVFDRGKTIDGATSFANGFRVTDSSGDGIVIYRDATSGPMVTCVVSTVENDCDKVFKLNSGKALQVKNSSGTNIFVVTETTGAVTEATINAESSGNTITLPYEWDMDTAACVAGSASHIWNTGIITAPTATCATGSNRVTAWANFPDSDGDVGMYISKHLPTGWTGNLDATIWWNTTGTGNAIFQIATKCYADDEADDAAFNTASTATAAAGTSGRPNVVTMSAITTTGCAAGELIRLKFLRNRTHASDTLNAALNVEKVIFTYRVAR